MLRTVIRSSTYHSMSLALTFCRHERLADHHDFSLVEMQNGPTPTPRDTVNDIKATAKEQVGTRVSRSDLISVITGQVYVFPAAERSLRRPESSRSLSTPFVLSKQRAFQTHT